MNLPEDQCTSSDRLIVGFSGVSLELMAALNLCRTCPGRVLYREKDVLVLEFTAEAGAITALLARLPPAAVTHLWRSDPSTSVRSLQTNFPRLLRHVTVPQDVRSCVCAAAGPSGPAADSFPREIRR